MDDGSALLAAIAAHPAEDTPRLAYADWLDEHSFPVRAEFIRIQCELARIEDLPRAEHDRYIELYRRQEVLLTHHRNELLGSLGNDLTNAEMSREVRFVRGFLAELKLDGDRFVKYADTIAAMKPLPEVQVFFRQQSEHSFPFDEHSELISVLHLETDGDPSDLDPFIYLQSPRQWTRLHELNLEGCGIEDRELQTLAESPRFPALTNLNLSGNGISDLDVQLLVGSPLWPRLKNLWLGGNPISDVAAEALADAAGTSRLEYLDLRHTAISPNAHPILLRRYGGRVALF